MASTQTAPKPKPLRLIGAMDLHLLKPPRLVGNSHLVAEGLNLIFGPSGAYKSFLALGLALHIAQTEGVVYVAAEGSSGLSIRVDAWSQHTSQGVGNLHFICEAISLLDADAIDHLITTLKALSAPTRLVIFDTYARCLPGGDENSSTDAGIAVENCAKIQRDLSAAVLILHHTNKAGTSERGSNALRGAADSIIEVSAHDDSVRIECSKIKDWEPWPTESLRFKKEGDSGLLLPASQVAAPAGLGARETKILEALTLPVFENCGARANQIADVTGIKGGGLYRALSSLKKAGFIHQSKRGDPFFIGPLGEGALQGDPVAQAGDADPFDVVVN